MTLRRARATMAGTRRTREGDARDGANGDGDAAAAAAVRASAKAPSSASGKGGKSSKDKAEERKSASKGGKSASVTAAPVTEENRLKRETAFLCHMQFKNDLPAVPLDWKMLQTRVDRRTFTDYSHLSLYDGLRKRGDFSDDLGIPLDPALMRAYRVPAQRATLDPEDHDILLDASERESKRAGGTATDTRAASRPDASDALWLMNTQYISGGTIKARTGLSEKEMKRRKVEASRAGEAPERELSQVEQIERSFEMAKKPLVHPTKKGLTVVEVLPVLPDFERMPLDYVRMLFDEKQELDVPSLQGKPRDVVDKVLDLGVVKPFSIVNDDDQTERFLSLMLPHDVDAATKEDYLPLDGDEKPYDYVREYVYKIQQDDPAMGGGNMCFFFKKDRVTYVDLHTKLTLSKKTKHSKGKNSMEHVPVSVGLKRRRLNDEEQAAFDAKKASVMA